MVYLSEELSCYALDAVALYREFYVFLRYDQTESVCIVLVWSSENQKLRVRGLNLRTFKDLAVICFIEQSPRFAEAVSDLDGRRRTVHCSASSGF